MKLIQVFKDAYKIFKRQMKIEKKLVNMSKITFLHDIIKAESKKIGKKQWREKMQTMTPKDWTDLIELYEKEYDYTKQPTRKEKRIYKSKYGRKNWKEVWNADEDERIVEYNKKVNNLLKIKG